MKRITINIFVLLICSILLLSGCNNQSIDKHQKDILKSMEKVVSIDKNIKFFDSEVLVYEETEKYIIDGVKANVEKTILSLGNSFELESKSENSTIDNLDKTKLFNLVLKEELLENIVYEKERLKFEVSNSNFEKVFNNSSMSISGNALVEFVYSDKMISEINISFTTISNKSVVVNVKYSY